MRPPQSPSYLRPVLLAFASAGALACAPPVLDPPTQPTSCATADADSSRVVDTAAVHERPRLRSAGRGTGRYPTGHSGVYTAGTVVLDFVVGADGRVERSSVRVESATDSVFVAFATDIVIEARWWPACLNGRRVPVPQRQVVTFDPPTV